MTIENKPEIDQVKFEKALLHFNEILDECFQYFDYNSKVDMASSIVEFNHLNSDDDWIIKLEKRLRRKFSEIEKFKIDIFYRVYSFHGESYFRGKGIGVRRRGEMFNE